jgi:nucleotide-binding universal stress UspA family protein
MVLMIFDGVLCAVDVSAESVEAVRQAARLAEPEGRLVLVSVCEAGVAVHAGMLATEVLADLREEAESALTTASGALPPGRIAETRLVEGRAAELLLHLAAGEHATLLCAGAGGQRRATGILLGSTVTRLVHEAPCSVLVARAPLSGAFPSSIVVGVDGSPEAEAAARVAFALQERFGASLRVVAAAGGKGVDVQAVGRAHPDVEPVPAKPVEALVAGREQPDLIVVGSKGLHGLRALGSVSERVAHRARCSVLVVR